MLWFVTMLSKGNAVWETLASHWRITIGVLAGILLIWFVHHYDSLRVQAQQNKALSDAVVKHLDQEKQSESIGIDLENQLNHYRAVVRAQPSAGGDPLTPEQLQRINARIAASNTTRRGNE